MKSGISIKSTLIFLGALVVAVGLLGIIGAFTLLANFKETLSDSTNATALLRAQGDADMMHDAFRGDYFGALLRADKPHAAEAKKDLAEHKKNWLAANSTIKATPKPADIEKAFLAVELLVADYMDLTEKLVGLAPTDQKAALASMETFDQKFEALEKTMATLTTLIEKRNHEVTAAAAAKAQTSTTAVTAFGLILMAVIIGLLLFASRVIGRQVKLITRAAHELSTAEADLTRRLPDLTGELGQLGRAMNGFVARLHDIVSDVTMKSSSIAIASTQISMGSVDLSSRTEQQAATLEETASSMEEFTNSIRQTADNTKTAALSARGAIENAETGRRIVTDAGKRMTDIHASAKRITEITNIIDSIAFQTNILALNAAVEAARAGEQGRGFAVVASEVRALAQRSASSAKDIKRLIDETTDSIDAGTVLVQSAEVAMDKIVQSNQDVLLTITEISNASGEQSIGVDHINRAVTQLEGVTQQNAALVEESAAAAESMRAQADDLYSLVSQFKLDSAPDKGKLGTAPRASGSGSGGISATNGSRSQSRTAVRARRTEALTAQNAPRQAAQEKTGPDWAEF
jgi:methyl-accepting chemotaxis protein